MNILEEVIENMDDEIISPSKVFQEIGDYMAELFREGLENGQRFCEEVKQADTEKLIEMRRYVKTGYELAIINDELYKRHTKEYVKQMTTEDLEKELKRLDRDSVIYSWVSAELKERGIV